MMEEIFKGHLNGVPGKGGGSTVREIRGGREQASWGLMTCTAASGNVAQGSVCERGKPFNLQEALFSLENRKLCPC